MKIKFFILFFLIINLNSIYAQEKDSVQVKKYNKTLSFVTDALIDRGIRFELEIPLIKNSFLSISPTYFLSNRYATERNEYNYYHDFVIETNLASFGIDVSYKYKLWNDERKITPYFALNGFFKWHRKELDGTNCYYDDYYIDKNDNSTYYGERTYIYFNEIRTVDIKRYGADLLIGSQFEIVPRIVFDFSFGLRYIQTVIGENDGGYFSNNLFEKENIAYTGFKPIGFYKIGFKF
ncbi:MAG: hypothetical protein IPO21_02145 [Bacteroidales bacterium]|nr:hypothetical protein [Bacteroidales bacterium]